MSSVENPSIPVPHRPLKNNPPNDSAVIQNTERSPGLLTPGLGIDTTIGQSRYHGSTTSLALSHSDTGTNEGKRRLLMVYIHGFVGSEESFHDFPKHVHDLLTISLRETHVVYTKIYPRYKTRGPVHIARDNFSQWISPHEAPDLDVILLGHSLGGIVAAEVALMPIQSATRLVPDTRLNHRILGLVNFDVPFFGLHPRVVTTGIGRLFRHKPGETSDTTDSVASINESISSPDTTFNPAFQNDVKLTQWNGWDGAWHFISKYSHHLSRSILQYAYSYYDHAGCMNNYPELFKRHKQLMRLEAIDEFSQDSQAQSRGASRVRFVNYFTKSTGTIRAGGADNSFSTHIVRHEDLRKCDWQGILEDATNILEMDHKPGHARRKSSPHGLVDSAGLLRRKQDICPKSSGGQHSSLHLESSVRTVVQSAVTDGQDENPKMGCERSNQSQAARRQFCYLPKNISNGKEHLWIPVQMEGIDEITAHQSMFLPQGTYYDKLVGDTVALIEGWISDDLTRRTILEGGFCK
ncbi:hypothetical protein BDV32DRAFT_20984 [Aspergillus pseudonomiae]|uniref:Uncharacterized protein n=1 Tax=Aspergillus pseudonomiae TaxID=1506151 RepID=A0A5N6I8R5_9EURO|nr:uncharacterized protein BDV37DRAFT_185592 [Aspergillus pseudonomiae]KAB8262574.1 hypothetical protein BDV32DRAFT_20984 [Aspergillus pseudonomiae]KAE8401164.1 hypothetical protein BDV37DRAFT_185592 [Aspergillus pseudonomiae]